MKRGMKVSLVVFTSSEGPEEGVEPVGGIVPNEGLVKSQEEPQEVELCEGEVVVVGGVKVVVVGVRSSCEAQGSSATNVKHKTQLTKSGMQSSAANHLFAMRSQIVNVKLPTLIDRSQRRKPQTQVVWQTNHTKLLPFQTSFQSYQP